MITKHQKIGEIRKAYGKEPLSESFKMMDSDLELKVTIFYHASVILDVPVLSCSATFELYRKTGNSSPEKPIIKITGNAPRTDEISPGIPPEIALGWFSLTGSPSWGFHLRFDQVEIQSIHFSEGERLLAFFKNMYGISIVYEADILSFLGKSGKEDQLKFPLPYPDYELA